MKIEEEILIEFLDKNGFDFELFKSDHEYSAKNILLAMEEFGNQRFAEGKAEGKIEGIEKAMNRVIEQKKKFQDYAKRNVFNEPPITMNLLLTIKSELLQELSSKK
jgi:hypothetical protein